MDSLISHLNAFSSIFFHTFQKLSQCSFCSNADLELWACGLVTMQIVAEGVNTSHELKPTITLCKLLCSVLIKWLPLARSSCWTFAWISRFRLNTVSFSRKCNSCEVLFTRGTEFTISVFNLKFIKYCDWGSTGHRRYGPSTKCTKWKLVDIRIVVCPFIRLITNCFTGFRKFVIVVCVTVCRASLWCMLVIEMALCMGLYNMAL